MSKKRFFQNRPAPHPPSPDSGVGQGVEDSLSAIYRDESGKMPDLTKLEPTKSRWWLFALITSMVFVAFVLAAVWAGFSYFKPFRGFSGQGLEIMIEGPEKVSLGAETTYFINYKNLTSEPLASADLRVSFPTDFVVTQVEPQIADTALFWRLGAIPVDGRGTITVRGIFTGALGTVTAVQVVGNYRPASFNSDFEALATKVLNYSDSVLEGDLQVPVKILPGDEAAFTYTVQNKGDKALTGLYCRFTLPEGFQLETTSTAFSIDGRNLLTPLPDLAEGASTTVDVKGVFASGISGEVHVIAETGRLGEDGAFLTGQKSETSFTVLAGDLSLKLVVNGKDTDAAIAYGVPLHFGISYENTSSEDLKNVVLHLRFESASGTSSSNNALLVDWQDYVENASGTRKGNEIIWDDDSIAALKRLPPREEAMLDVSLKALPAVSGTDDLAVRAVLEAEIGSVGETKVNRVVKAAPIVLRYLSDADFFSEARFFSEEGVQVGAGPLPPLVGQGTKYRVEWAVKKNFHELKNLKITATLPKIAMWTNNTLVEAGELSYDENTRMVTWTLNKMPEDVDRLLIDFDITITPTEADANRFAKLLGESKFEAADVNANASLL
ncbi:hypothetical protein KKF59_03725, partial [Patescibacteria group bacterium]|nr:hypothetical protein [Patescibacteria group bacterium]